MLLETLRERISAVITKTCQRSWFSLSLLILKTFLLLCSWLVVCHLKKKKGHCVIFGQVPQSVGDICRGTWQPNPEAAANTLTDVHPVTALAQPSAPLSKSLDMEEAGPRRRKFASDFHSSPLLTFVPLSHSIVLLPPLCGLQSC